MTIPKFSIVIPTADRHHLLEKTVAACLLSPYQNLEVLVSDNFSMAETAKVVDKFRQDPRVRYVRTDRRLPMHDHWEFAWKQSTGDFIIVNGDDDALSPQLIDRLAKIASTFNAGLISWDAGLYYHPDWNLFEPNVFTFMSGHSRMLIEVDPQAVVASYARLQTPICFPQGTRICFSRQLANRALGKTGRLFWGPYPDYSAPLLLLGLLQGERYIYWDALAGHGGRSRHSNAAAWERQSGKTGDAQRARDYFNEFEEEDVYPHSDLKIKAYANGHAETLNLLRCILPDAFARHCVDQTAFIAAVESEFRGINIHNPFLGPRERAAFDAFLAKQDPATVATAMRQVDERALNHDLHRWHKKPTTPLEDILRLIPKLITTTKASARGAFDGHARRGLLNKFKSLLHGWRKELAGPSSTVRLQYKGRMVKVYCADLNCHDTLDLTRQIDQIADRFDIRGWKNIELFANAELLRAAYATTVESPVRSTDCDES